MVNAFLTIKHGLDEIGTLHLELYHNTVPRTVDNFMALLEGRAGQRLTFRNSVSHRLIPGFMAQFGDITRGDGTGGESIYGPTFDDENFIKRHDRKGTLSMANSGPNTNGSQFFITFRNNTPHLDGKHVVFGHVDLEKSGAALAKLERIKTDKEDKPLKPVVIVDCGVVLDDEDDNEDENPPSTTLEESEPTTKKPAQPDDAEIDEEEEEEPDADGGENFSKSQAIRSRLRKLKMKMNQARQLNRKALQREGEAMGSEEGKIKQRNQQRKQEKKLKQEAWEANNARAVMLAEETGVDAKFLVEPASASLKTAAQRAEKKEASRFSVNDFYNPEGQHRHYERNLKSIPRHGVANNATSVTFNPMMEAVDPEKEREGARRLANELHRRIQKAAKKRNRLEFDETDVTYINQRNKRFNQKISRDYDQATAEIKQNLERGTAL